MSQSATPSNDPLSPWKGQLPAIGIRPTVDGRLGGVRESLAERCINYTGADLEDLVRRAGLQALRQASGNAAVVADGTNGAEGNGA